MHQQYPPPSSKSYQPPPSSQSYNPPPSQSYQPPPSHPYQPPMSEQRTREPREREVADMYPGDDQIHGTIEVVTPYDPFIKKISDMVDKYWNGAKSLTKSPRFKSKLSHKCLEITEARRRKQVFLPSGSFVQVIV